VTRIRIGQALPVTAGGKTPTERVRHVAGRAFFIALEGICGEDTNSVRFAEMTLAAMLIVSFPVVVL
jgi:hypothetical protein